VSTERIDPDDARLAKSGSDHERAAYWRELAMQEREGRRKAEAERDVALKIAALMEGWTKSPEDVLREVEALRSVDDAGCDRPTGGRP
jgi:hypothetical protein